LSELLSGIHAAALSENANLRSAGFTDWTATLLVPTHNAQRARRVLDTPFDAWPEFSQAGPRRCPQCGEEAEERLDQCRHCGAPLRPERPPPRGSPEEASFIQTLLESRAGGGDEARRQADNPYAPPRAAEQEPQDADDDDLDDVAGRERCPGCGRARVATCPFCKTSGSRFRPADLIASHPTGAEPALLICPMCDEPFEPAYLRTCEWCGYDCGDGVESPEIVRSLHPEPLNWRVVLVGVTGVAIIGALVAYFAWLL
jgi:hypothetical protein